VEIVYVTEVIGAYAVDDDEQVLSGSRMLGCDRKLEKIWASG